MIIKGCFLLAFGSWCLFASSQVTIERSVIGSAGSYSNNASLNIEATAGEVFSNRSTNGSISIKEGFLQVTGNLLKDLNIYYYTGFSPNSDGINDTWVIEGINKFPDNTVVIYNRWGQELWHGEGYDNKTVVWSGVNSSGKSMETGTYLFVIELPEVERIKGWVELTSNE